MKVAEMKSEAAEEAKQIQAGGITSGDLSFDNIEDETEEKSKEIDGDVETGIEEKGGKEEKPEEKEEGKAEEKAEEKEDEEVDEEKARLKEESLGRLKQIEKLREKIRSLKQTEPGKEIEKQEEYEEDDLANKKDIKQLEGKINFLLGKIQENEESQAEINFKQQYPDYEEAKLAALELMQDTEEGVLYEILVNHSKNKPLQYYQIGKAALAIKGGGSKKEFTKKEKTEVENVLEKVKKNAERNFVTPAGLAGDRAKVIDEISETEYLKMKPWEPEQKYGKKIAAQLKEKYGI